MMKKWIAQSRRDQLCFSAMLDFQARLGPGYQTSIRALDELLERDKLREQDGFPRKITLGRLVKPGKGDRTRITVVPSTVEEKFIHDRLRTPQDEEASGGAGQGEEGEVVGEEPLDQSGGSGQGGAGEGETGPHELESSAYDLGKMLTEQFELPNLQQKGKKRSLTHYTYDLTDRHRGMGQLLDKKATLRRILQTNISLGRASDRRFMDPRRFLVSPRDKVYRILSREKTYESQALVFFLRDYSASMWGKPTQIVTAQHVLIYSWLVYQYARRVETRFILHDTEAKEVPDFYTYYNSKVAGGTKIAAAYRLVNQMIEEGHLAQDYNIYVFQGTDGDDWDREGGETLSELRKILLAANRVGVTVVRGASSEGSSQFESYLLKSGLLEEQPDLIRLDQVAQDADEQRLIRGIRTLTSETLPAG